MKNRRLRSFVALLTISAFLISFAGIAVAESGSGALRATAKPSSISLSNYGYSNYYTDEGIVFGVSGKSIIRRSPYLDGASLGTFPQYASADYLGEKQYDNRGVAWYKIYYQGTTGWVSSKYTFLSIIIDDSYYYGRSLWTNGKSYIRSAPSTDAKDVGSITKNVSCMYMGKRTSDMNGRVWYYISYNGKVGWVSSRYVDF